MYLINYIGVNFLSLSQYEWSLIINENPSKLQKMILNAALSSWEKIGVEMENRASPTPSPHNYSTP